MNGEVYVPTRIAKRENRRRREASKSIGDKRLAWRQGSVTRDCYERGVFLPAGKDLHLRAADRQRH